MDMKAKKPKDGTGTGTILLKTLYDIQMNVFLLILSLFLVTGSISGFKRLIDIIKARQPMFKGFYH